jgi:hypothetical protein
MTCGWAVNLLQTERGWEFIPACRVIFFAYAGIGAVKFLLSVTMSHKVEAEVKKKASKRTSREDSEGEESGVTQPLLGDRPAEQQEQQQQQPERKSVLAFLGDRKLASLVIRLFILFGVDSFASGLASLYVPSSVPSTLAPPVEEADNKTGPG